MTIVASAGFYGYTLTNVLYLTGVWKYSVLEAGLALTPGPFVAAAIAGPASRFARRFGHRVVLAVGGLWWGAAVLWFVVQVGPTPDFLGDWLPGMILLGIGAGTTFPTLAGAAVASAAGESYATSTSLNSVARQLGAAIGVAIVVAIIGTPTILNVLDVFDNAWTFAAACLIGAGIGCLAVSRVGADDETARTPDLATAARLVLTKPDAPAPEALREPTRARPERGEPVTAPPRPETTADFLGHAPIFSGLTEPLREALAKRSTAVRLAAGEWLFREGDPGESMYIVRAGRLEVIAERAGETAVRELGRGAALGELALLTSESRSASVRAARDADLIAIERDQFERLLETAPEISLALNRVLASQLRESRGTVSKTRPLPVTIAIVSLDDRMDVRELAARLARTLGRRARVTTLDGSETGHPGGNVDAAATYGPILDRAEAADDLVLLAGAGAVDPDPWTRFCLQQADRVLAVGRGGDPPAEGTSAALQGCDMVVYDVGEGSRALSGWVGLLDPIETHVVRTGPGLNDDFARMARRLTGRSLGIVLSGGGARAFSHMGVLAELEAAGLVIDRVAGVSMGAYIGAMFALGMGFDEMDARAYEEWVRRRPLGDYTFPRHSLIRGHRVQSMFERTFGEVQIEELRRSFFCACAELRRAELIVNRHGSLLDAVGNSVRIPVLGPPEVRDRQLIVDGSLIDNLPVSTMAELGEGPIIAVDVKASFEGSGDPRGGERDGTEKGLAPGRAARAPALAETLTRVLLLGSANTSDAARRHADLTIKPRNIGVGLLEFHQLDRAIDAGRAAAREALEQAPPQLFS